MPRSIRPLVSIVLALGLFASEASHALQMDSRALAPACEAAEWGRIERELREAADGHRPSALIRLGKTYLCGHDAAATRYLLQHAPTKVLRITQARGERSSIRLIPRAQAVRPQGGAAWDFDIAPGTRRSRVVFHTSLECTGGATFALKGSVWLIVAIHEVCF
jgi:hypothetical protein